MYLEESNLINEDYSFKYLDTTLYNFELFDFPEKYNMKYQNLGNLGTALFDLEYDKPKGIKLSSGFDAYLPYYQNYKKIKFYPENEIEQKLGSLWKNTIWLDSLSCSVYYKNLLKKNNKIIDMGSKFDCLKNNFSFYFLT